MLRLWNKKKEFGELLFCADMWAKLFLQEAGLQDNAAAIDLAIHLFGVVCKTNTLYLCSALDDH
jgi:hypothetical protein